MSAIMDILKILGVLLLAQCSFGQDLLNVQSGQTSARVYTAEDQLLIEVYYEEELKLRGQLGRNLELRSVVADGGVIVINEEETFYLETPVPGAINVAWWGNRSDAEYTDCYDLGTDNWFGGPELWSHHWPLEKTVLDNWSAVTKEDSYSAIGDVYWLSSNGTYIYGSYVSPLWIDQKNIEPNGVCFIARASDPYPPRETVYFYYSIASFPDPKQAHQHAVRAFLGRPSGHPDETMIRYPIWSTWARYRTDFNQSVMEQFVQEIYDHGYENSQIEVDDIWEDCYGTFEFDLEKFPDIAAAVDNVHSKGFRATLWTHPFVNKVCEEISQVGLDRGYFVHNLEGDTSTQWWNSDTGEARIIDFTNPAARDWWIGRLQDLQTATGFDSYKFDAGETSWTPQIPYLNDVDTVQPNVYTSDYVQLVSLYFGRSIEVRSGSQTQHLPVFLRMLDKNSSWGDDAGLLTLITVLLQLNINGYTMVLPDLIGGNAYGSPPDKELFIRWLQATTFMPAIQFSFTPWDYDEEAISISYDFVQLHENYTPVILQAMNASIQQGTPVNPPIWWVDPTDRIAHGIDDEYLLGERILVAPVLTQGAVTRDVYLPRGLWLDGNDGTVYEGPAVLDEYEAPLNKLPYFTLL